MLERVLVVEHTCLKVVGWTAEQILSELVMILMAGRTCSKLVKLLTMEQTLLILVMVLMVEQI